MNRKGKDRLEELREQHRAESERMRTSDPE
jgi:hypothetical protein